MGHIDAVRNQKRIRVVAPLGLVQAARRNDDHIRLLCLGYRLINHLLRCACIDAHRLLVKIEEALNTFVVRNVSPFGVQQRAFVRHGIAHPLQQRH